MQDWRRAFCESLRFVLRRELGRPHSYGCVSWESSGSHSDMDAASFLCSVEAICTCYQTADWSGIRSFAELRRLGQELEAQMYAATCGVNTHKGWIFLTIFLAYAWSQGWSWEAWPRRIEAFAEPLWADYRSLQFQAGAQRRAGLSDIRQIPLQGYRPALAILRRAQAEAWSDGRLTLYLLGRVDDTTTLRRASLPVLRSLQQQARQAFLCDSEELAQDLDQRYLAAGLSSGGVADLFSLIRLLERLETLWTSDNSIPSAAATTPERGKSS